VQFTKPYKQAIARGELTTSFRTWKSPQAKVGGQYNIPPYGAIEVHEIRQLKASSVNRAALQRAGLKDAQALYDFLQIPPDAHIYQVDFHFLDRSPVKQVEHAAVDAAELERIIKRLQRMDKDQPWTQQALRLISSHPGVGARVLAPQCDMELAVFKRNIRKLKSLGLTISLDTGYKLSARGEQLLAHPLFKR